MKQPLPLISPPCSFLQEDNSYSKISITDNVAIHMVHTIVTDNPGRHWVHSEDHTDVKNYEVTKTFAAISGKTYTIYIDATGHNGNLTQKELTVSAN